MKYINNEYFYTVNAFIFDDNKSVKNMLESEDFTRFLENIGCQVKIQRNNGEVLVYAFPTERLIKYSIKKFREKFNVKN